VRPFLDLLDEFHEEVVVRTGRVHQPRRLLVGEGEVDSTSNHRSALYRRTGSELVPGAPAAPAARTTKPAAAAAPPARPRPVCRFTSSRGLLVEHELLRVDQRPQDVLVRQPAVLGVALDVLQGHLQVLGTGPAPQGPEE